LKNEIVKKFKKFPKEKKKLQEKKRIEIKSYKKKIKGG